MDEVAIGAQGEDPATARFVPPPAMHVQALMSNFEEFIGNPEPMPSLLAAAVARYQFETIIPPPERSGRP